MRGLAIAAFAIAFAIPASGCRYLLGIEGLDLQDADDADDAAGADADADVDGDPSLPDAGVADASPDSPPAPDAVPVCPVGYDSISASLTSRYRIVSANMRWLQAEQECETDGTHLVVIDDLAENNALDDAVEGNFWLGVTDTIAEGTYLRVTGGPITFVNFTSGQPDGGTSQNCLDLGGSGSSTWGDRNCDINLDFVCECDGAPADPSSYDIEGFTAAGRTAPERRRRRD